MKHCLVFSLVAFLFLAGTTQAQDRLLTQFYHAHRGVAVTFKMNIGRVPMRFVTNMIPNDSKSNNGDAKLLFSKIHKIKFYAMQGIEAPIPTSDLLKLKKKLIDKEHFDVLMEVRDHGSFIHVLNKGADDELGNVVLLFQDEKEIFMVHMHTSLKMDDINMLINEFNTNIKTTASL